MRVITNVSLQGLLLQEQKLFEHIEHYILCSKMGTLFFHVATMTVLSIGQFFQYRSCKMLCPGHKATMSSLFRHPHHLKSVVTEMFLESWEEIKIT